MQSPPERNGKTLLTKHIYFVTRISCQIAPTSCQLAQMGNSSQVAFVVIVTTFSLIFFSQSTEHHLSAYKLSTDQARGFFLSSPHSARTGESHAFHQGVLWFNSQDLEMWVPSSFLSHAKEEPPKSATRTENAQNLGEQGKGQGKGQPDQKTVFI